MHNLHTEEHYFDRWIKKKKTQTRQYSSRENYYKVTSGRGTELKLWSIGGEYNRQTNKISVFHGVKRIPS